MKVVATVAELREAVATARNEGAVIGLVPTMGALHEGHVSLVRAARSDCGFVVVSIFVNPLQFGANEDLDAYPRDLENDVKACTEAGADLIFAPEVSEVYPEPMATVVSVEGVSEGLCADSRPGHFDGVSTVVAKLFNLVLPDRAYFGRKDAQQLAVISRMVRDLAFPVEVVGCPTVREAEGLAMSSRNQYLDEAGRRGAVAIFRGLRRASEMAVAGEMRSSALENAVIDEVEREPLLMLEYCSLRDADSIEPLGELPKDGRAILAVAARVTTPDGGGARLIDNFVFEIDGGRVSVDEGLLASTTSLRATS